MIYFSHILRCLSFFDHWYFRDVLDDIVLICPSYFQSSSRFLSFFPSRPLQETGLMTSLGTCLSQAFWDILEVFFWDQIELHGRLSIEFPCLNTEGHVFLSFSERSLPCKFVDESHCTWSFYHLFGHVRCRIGNPRIKLNASFLCLIHWRIREDSRFSQPCFINLLFHFQWHEKETPTLSMTVDAQCSSKTGGEPPFLMVRSC